MPEKAAGKLIALRRITKPQENSQENEVIEPGKEFTPVSDESRERLLRIGAAAEPRSKEASAAKKEADADADAEK